MNLTKFSVPPVDAGLKFRAPVPDRNMPERFGAPSANRPGARKGDRSVPAGPSTGHCPSDPQGAP